MLRQPNQRLREQCSSIQHFDQGKALVEYLEAEKQNALELLAKAPDDLVIRRLQGVALALSDLLDLLNPRRP